MGSVPDTLIIPITIMQTFTRALIPLKGKRETKGYPIRLSDVQLTTSSGDQLPLTDREANRVKKQGRVTKLLS